MPHTMAWRDTWPVDCRFSIDRGVKEAQAGRSFVFRTRFTATHVAGVYLDTTISAVRDEDGRIVRLLVKAEDVTAETESAAFLNTVIDVLPLALTVKDARTGRYILANRSAEKLFGKFEGLTGLRAADVLPAAFAEWAADPAPGMGSQSAIHEDPAPNGVRYLSSIKVATYDDEGVRHLIGLTQDVIQKQKDDDALTLALEQAEQASRARSAFISNISHEVRTPLNGVMAGVDLLSQKSEAQDLAEVTAMIRVSAAALQDSFQQLLSISELHSASAERRFEVFDLAALIDRIVEPHRANAEAKRLTMSVEVSAAVPSVLVGDPEQLAHALTPLLHNAVKFTEEGNVRLTVKPHVGGIVRFTCIDTGIGFDPDHKDALFGAFHQQDGALTRKFGGMGLGLALARDKARLLGGSMDAEPRAEGGSIFWLDVPLSPAPTEIATESQTLLKVLVADDHPTNRRIVEIMLEGMADVTLAEDGVEALEAARRQQFDIILMDIQMPRMDGITAVARIREAEDAAGQAPVPIIMLTANTQPEHLAAAKHAGANRHVGKPFTSALLLSEIQAVLAVD